MRHRYARPSDGCWNCHWSFLEGPPEPVAEAASLRKPELYSNGSANPSKDLSEDRFLQNQLRCSASLDMAVKTLRCVLKAGGI